MLRTKDYVKERQAVQIRIAEIDEEKKHLKLLLAPLNQLIAAAGAETNGNGHADDSEWEFDCRSPGCPRVAEEGFSTAQGRAVHERKAHGIKGASKK